jgi:hypothetical protein
MSLPCDQNFCKCDYHGAAVHILHASAAVLNQLILQRTCPDPDKDP